MLLSGPSFEELGRGGDKRHLGIGDWRAGEHGRAQRAVHQIEEPLAHPMVHQRSEHARHVVGVEEDEAARRDDNLAVPSQQRDGPVEAVEGRRENRVPARAPLA